MIGPLAMLEEKGLLGQLRSRVIEPHPETPTAHLEKARFLSGFLLVAVGVTIVSIFSAPDEIVPSLQVLTLVLVGVFLLGRTRHYVATAILAVIALSIEPFVAAMSLNSPLVDYRDGMAAFAWLLIGVTACSSLLSARGVIILAGCDLLLLAILTALSSSIALTATAPIMLLVATISIFLAIEGVARSRHLSRIEAQARALEDSESRFRSLFGATLEGIAICERSRIVAVNPAFGELFGVSTKAVEGRSVSDFVTDDSLDLEDGAFDKDDSLTGETGRGRTEATGKRANGTTFALELLAQRGHWYQGNQVHVLAFRDISEQKRVVDKLQEATELAETALRSKDQFMANMSHELRTPLNAVLGTSHILLDTELDHEQQELVEIIRQGGASLLSIVNDVLNYSSLSTEEIVLEERPFELHSCIEEALDLVTDAAVDKQLELVCLVEPDTPAFIIGDPRRLCELTSSLLSNAIKFTDTGSVVLRVRRSRIAGDQRHGDTSAVMLQLSVRDTGIGIPEEKTSSLYDPFSQVDNSSTRRYGGAGLGLAICRRITQLMGGRLWVDSLPGDGSTFHFTIRARLARSEAPPYLVGDLPPLLGTRCLVLADPEVNGHLISLYGARWGMAIKLVSTYSEALELLRKPNNFDIAIVEEELLSDDRTGDVASMRAVLPTTELPVVRFGFISAEIQTPPPAEGTVARLFKPLKPSALHRGLVDIMTRHAARSGRVTTTRSRAFDIKLGEKLPLRILIAEDNVINQKLTTRMLAKLGYDSDVATNGREAVNALRQRPYDVIFMDLHMPELDGMEATAQIRSDSALASQPRIIALTADVGEGTRQRCLDIGMNDYLTKPLRVTELVAALQRHGQESPSSSAR